MLYFFFLSIAFLFPLSAYATTFQVGPTRMYKKPCAVLTASPALAPGDIIEIDGADASGNQIEYVDDFCDWRIPNLTFRGVGEKRPHIRRQSGQLPGYQGIWRPSFANGTKSTYAFENLEMSGARSTAKNAQPIWAAYTSLIIRNCYFHDNDNGIMVFNEKIPSDQRIYDVIIEHSEFANNGNRDGQTHNVYVGTVRSLVFRYNFSHDSLGGQLLKSRAGISHVIYNRFVDSPSGISNYESDFSNGGRVYYIGNIVYQAVGNASTNSQILTYRPEGDGSTFTPQFTNVLQELYVVNNTFVNARSSGAFIRYYGTPTVFIKNNIFAGAGTVLYSPEGAQPNPADNIYAATVAAAGFVDPANQNYYLASGSTAIDKSVDAGSAFGQNLSPTQQYLHLAKFQARPVRGTAPDAGAYEYGTRGASGVLPSTLSGSSSSTGIVLQWSPAYSEEAPVNRYRIFKDGSLLTTTTTLSYTDMEAKPGVATSYYVIGENAASESSPPSNTVTIARVRQCVGSLGEESGWCQVVNTKMTNVCQPSIQCDTMLLGRAGAAYDTTRNQFVLWGGNEAHPGNEIYALNTNTLTMTRLNSSDTNLGNGEAIAAGGRPNRRSTFNNLAYIPDADKLFAFGGTGRFGKSLETWLWAPTTDTWTLTRATGTAPTFSWGAAAYNPNDGKVYYVDSACLRRYNPTTNTWEQPGVCKSLNSYHHSVVIDPNTQRLYIMGDFDYWYYDLSAGSSFTRNEIPALGCRDAVKATLYPGLVYDPKEKQIVIWTGGDTIYTLDATGKNCTAKTYLGGPGAPADGEVMSRWQYSPAAGGFFVVTEANKDAFFLRLPTSNPLPPVSPVNLLVR